MRKFLPFLFCVLLCITACANTSNTRNRIYVPTNGSGVFVIGDMYVSNDLYSVGAIYGTGTAYLDLSGSSNYPDSCVTSYVSKVDYLSADATTNYTERVLYNAFTSMWASADNVTNYTLRTAWVAFTSAYWIAESTTNSTARTLYEAFTQAVASANYATNSFAEQDDFTTFTNAQASVNSNVVAKTGDTMTGTLTINSGGNLIIDSAGTNISIGNGANGDVLGSAVGYQANGNSAGSAVGYQANGSLSGSAVGCQVNGSSYGSAVGREANGYNYGASVGYLSSGYSRGTAIGKDAVGQYYGVGIGFSANGAQTNIAIGYSAKANGGSERIAIGHSASNLIDNSALIRGDLYLDGATGIFYRAAFGSGSWSYFSTVIGVETTITEISTLETNMYYYYDGKLTNHVKNP